MTRDTDALKKLSKLARDNVYLSVLRPQLDELRRGNDKIVPKSSFEATKVCFERLERIKVVNSIIKLIEEAESRLDNIRNKI